jgi:tripartite-type tricarboxylate transporter receptor subunit TctC
VKDKGVLYVVLAALFLAHIPSTAFAQAYPNRPVKMVVPFPAGGPTDIVARPLAQKLSEALGQQVVIENKGGAGGNIGADTVAKSAPDGYTLLMGTVGTHAINASLYKKLPYDPVKDFAPISQIASAPLLLVAHPSLPANSVRELIQLAKAKPGYLSFGSAGSGSPGHLSGELFKEMAKIELAHVPYKGSAPAVTDLLGGQIPLMFDPIQSVLPHVKAGKIKALGVTSLTRSAVAPEVPTIDEAGVPGYVALAWWGVLAPAGTPKAILVRLNSEIVKILQTAEMKERLSGLGAEPAGSTPEQFTAHIKSEMAKWGRIVEQSGAAVD